MERSNDVTPGKKHNRTGYFVISLSRYLVQRKGFTLVELIVSVAITGILMLGLSVFFSSTFQGLFKAQTQTVNTEKQYAINEIIRDKFSTIETVLNTFTGNPLAATEILFRNKNTKDQLPFSYIGVTERDGNKYLALKDVMIFNKVYLNFNDNLYADSGSSKIKRAGLNNDEVLKLPDNLKNFSSFEIIGNTIYIVLPDKNEVLTCSCNNGVCSDCANLPNMPKFQSPTDITKDRLGKFLYISDSGNGKVIKYDVDSGQEYATENIDELSSPVVRGLKYPTGLAYYDDGTTEWLFVAETLGNKIRKINLTTPSVINTVVGEGDDQDCGSKSSTWIHTAKFCKLNMPTGIFADDAKQELYISDSGNNRILKMKDPGVNKDPLFKFSAKGNYYLDAIIFQNDAWTGGTYDAGKSNLFADDDLGSYYDNLTKTYSNLKRLTVFSAAPCESDQNSFYSNEDPLALDIQADDPATPDIIDGDMLYINDKAYTIGLTERKDCKLLAEDPELNKWKITMLGTLDPVLDNGDEVHLSNPKDIEIQINGITTKPEFKGFQTTKILIYDFVKRLVDTEQVVERVGDGILGTDEDTIEVFVAKLGAQNDQNNNPDISFPTGLTNSYFANSGATLDKSEVIRFGNAITNKLESLSTEAFDVFDYVSDFTLDLADPVKFIEYKYDSGNLLELVIKASVDADKPQTYILNAHIPK